MKQVIVIRKDLGMRTGKIAVQAAHASVGAAMAARDANWAEELLWQNHGQKKVALRAYSEEMLTDLEEAAARLQLPFYLVKDEGRTQVEPNTLTAIAIGPAEDEIIDRLTRTLKLF